MKGDVVAGLARVQGPYCAASRSLVTPAANPLKGGVQTFRVENVSLGAVGGYGRAKGTVRSKAEPWNERRVENISLGVFVALPVVRIRNWTSGCGTVRPLKSGEPSYDGICGRLWLREKKEPRSNRSSF